MNDKNIIKKVTNDNHLRNRAHRIDVAKDKHPVINFLKKYKKKCYKKSFLEIGCSTGFVLEKIRKEYKSDCYGVDSSLKAINEGRKIFRKIHLKNAFSDNFFFKRKFDFIILGFFLFLVPPRNIFYIFSNIMSHLKDGGYIVVYDFYNNGKFKKKKYKHSNKVFCYRYDFKKVLLSLPCFKLIEKRISYIKKMRDYVEVSLIKKINI